MEHHSSEPTRRRLLAGAALATLPLAGCLDASPTVGASGDDEDGPDTEDESEDDGGASEESGADDASETEAEDGDDGDVEPDEADLDAAGDALADYETVGYSTAAGDTRIETLFSASDAEREIEFDRLDDGTAADVEAFLEETDFGRSVVFLLAVRAPNLCYGIDLEELTADADGVSVRARAVDDSASDEACAQAVHVPTVLLRVVFEEGIEVPGSGSVHLVDAQGRERGYGYDSASESVSGDETDGGRVNEEASGEGSDRREDGDEAGEDETGENRTDD